MRLATIIRWLVALAGALAAMYAVLHWDALLPARRSLRMTMEVTTLQERAIEVFAGDGIGFDAGRSERHTARALNIRQRVHFTHVLDTTEFSSIRIDPGDVPGDLLLHRIMLEGPGGTVELDGPLLKERVRSRRSMELLPGVERTLLLRCTAGDPQFVLDLDQRTDLLPILHAPPRMLRLVLASLAGVIAFGLLYFILQKVRPAAAPDRAMAVIAAVDILIFLAVFGAAQQMGHEESGIHVRFQVLTPHDDQWHMFYTNDTEHFDGRRSMEFSVQGSKNAQWTSFALPQDTFPRFLRLDPGSHGDTVVVFSAALVHGDAMTEIPLADILPTIEKVHDVDSILPMPSGLLIRPSGNDPYFTIALDLRGRMTALAERDAPFLLPFIAAILITLIVHAGVARSSLRSLIAAATVPEVVLAAGFLVLIAVPITVWFNPALEPRSSFSEKRRLAQLPDLEFASIGSYPGELDRWYREHFGMRSELFRWNSWVHWAALNTSSLPDKVVVGKDGWLFQYNDHVDGNYRGLTKYSFAELEQIRHKYEERQKLLAGYGIDYYLMIPPLSGSINREHLPDRIHRVSSTTWLDQVRDHFVRYSTVPLIDPTPSLLEAGKKAPIYFKTDIHWNPYGAYFGYRDLLTRIAKDRPEVGAPWPITDFDIVENTNENADLATMLGLNDVLTRVEPVFIPKRERTAEYFYQPQGLPGGAYFLAAPKTFISPDTSKLDLLMFHDSFGLYMMPLLSEHFHRSTFVWSGLFIPDIIPAERPDVVVQECMEMFIENMPKDNVPRSW